LTRFLNANRVHFARKRSSFLKASTIDMAKDTTGRLRVTVKSAGRMKLSSKLWLERQLNDPYVAQAKRDGLRSRAAYKLIEIDDKYHFLKRGISVVDLGAAPGGWSQIAAKRVGAADVVLSDMAANTTGHRKTDQLRIIGLVESAAAFAAEVLNPGGTFVAKVFQSGADAVLMTQLKRDFATVKHVKPASSRKDSSERYVLAMGFRGVQAEAS
jgi:23S rRNA (uridine2552-2'-O)-methyltransferase